MMAVTLVSPEEVGKGTIRLRPAAFIPRVDDSGLSQLHREQR